MLAEHEEGRRLVQAMESEQGTGRTEAARRYVQLLREHIDKENAVLFPLAEAVFDASTLQMLAQQFEAVEAEQGHDASTDRAEAEVEGLNSEYQSNHNSVS